MATFWHWIKTLVAVTLVTALVWLFAEAQTLRDLRAPVLVGVQPGPGDQVVVDVTNPPGPLVRVELEAQGSARSLDQAQRRFRAPLMLGTGQPGVPRQPGPHSLDLLAILREHPDVRELGLTIRSVEPASLDIAIDDFAVRELPIRVEAPGLELSGTPQISPARGRVTLPRKAAQALAPGAALVARIGRAEAQEMEPGKATTLSELPLTLPGLELEASRVRIEPVAADVVATLRSRVSEVVLAQVAVQLRVSPEDLGRFAIQVPPEQQFLRDVRVFGPDDLVERVRSGALSVTAEVALSSAELDAGIASKPAVITGLPAGLRAEPSSTRVELWITRRERR